MKFNRFAFLLLIPSLTLAESNIGRLGIVITQQGKPVASTKVNKHFDRLQLAKAAFQIKYKAQEIGVCVSTSASVFEKANQAVDTMSDFTSCLFTFKAFGMSKDGAELVANIDGANWLNDSHGAEKIQGEGYSYRVEKFVGKETGDLKLTQISIPMYLVFWNDRDKNKIIDIGEVAKVELKFN